MADPEIVEVPVTKVEVTISTEDMLNALARQSETLAGSTGAGAPAPEVVAGLQRVNEMAQRMLTELREVQRQDASVFDRLERGPRIPRPVHPRPPQP